MKEILTVAELAEYLRVNEATVYRLAQEGKIPGMKVGRQWRFKKQAIDRLLEEGVELASRAEKSAVSSG